MLANDECLAKLRLGRSAKFLCAIFVRSKLESNEVSWFRLPIVVIAIHCNARSGSRLFRHSTQQTRLALSSACQITSYFEMGYTALELTNGRNTRSSSR